MVYHLTADQLIDLIKDNPPEVIVFNACKSKSIARKVQRELARLGKSITTIGHQNNVQDFVCEVLADVFYPEVFNGIDVSTAFKNAKD